MIRYHAPLPPLPLPKMNTVQTAAKTSFQAYFCAFTLIYIYT